jgi:hypothetical protein
MKWWIAYCVGMVSWVAVVAIQMEWTFWQALMVLSMMFVAVALAGQLPELPPSRHDNL